jgi:hypothetical protein
LKRICARLRSRWPEVEIELRAHAGFAVPDLAVPDLYDYCERESITYTVGLITNGRLEENWPEDLLEEAKRPYSDQREKVKLFCEGRYRAGSWEHERRVLYKAELMEQGTNTRLLLTTRNDAPKDLYEFYVKRGASENWIKDFKLHIKADRLSCSRFMANQLQAALARFCAYSGCWTP